MKDPLRRTMGQVLQVISSVPLRKIEYRRTQLKGYGWFGVYRIFLGHYDFWPDYGHVIAESVFQLYIYEQCPNV